MNARASLLDEANSLVNGDRNVTYGDPTADFKRTAAYWNIHLNGVLARKLAHKVLATADSVQEIKDVIANLLDAHDVAILVDLVKTSRLAWSPEKRDNWVDKAGYAACGWECAAPVNSTTVSHGVSNGSTVIIDPNDAPGMQISYTGGN